MQCWSGLTYITSATSSGAGLQRQRPHPTTNARSRVTDPLSTLVLCGNVGWTITAKTKALAVYPGGDVPSVCFMYHCNGHPRDSPHLPLTSAVLHPAPIPLTMHQFDRSQVLPVSKQDLSLRLIDSKSFALVPVKPHLRSRPYVSPLLSGR
jgi:hypothetical protein